MTGALPPPPPGPAGLAQPRPTAPVPGAAGNQHSPELPWWSSVPASPVGPGDRFTATYQQGTGQLGHCELTCRCCGQQARFDNPTPWRVAQFGQRHRCGPRGSRWNEGDDTPTAVSTMASAQHAVTLEWFLELVEAQPDETYHDQRTFALAQRVNEVLDAKLAAATDDPTFRVPGDLRPAHMAGGRH